MEKFINAEVANANKMVELEFTQYPQDEGGIKEKIPEIISTGQRLATAAEVVLGKIEGKLLFERCYIMASAFAFPGDMKDEFKVIPVSEHVISLNPNTKVIRESDEFTGKGGIEITQEGYDEIDSTKSYAFSRKIIKLEHLLEQPLTEDQVVNHAIWLASLGWNKSLLERYAENEFRRAKNQHGLDKTMGVYVRGAQCVPNLRPAFLYPLYSGSALCDKYGVDKFYTVGVREKP